MVCCSCGNASKALKETGLYTVAIAPNGDLRANRWFKHQEIARMFPGLLDATSGHLPLPLMERIGQAYAECLTTQADKLFWAHHDFYLPTGSGETLLALRLVFAGTRFHPIRWKGNPATEFNHKSLLNHGLQLMNLPMVEEKQIHLNVLEIK